MRRVGVGEAFCICAALVNASGVMWGGGGRVLVYAGSGSTAADRKKTFSSGGAVGSRSYAPADQRRYNDNAGGSSSRPKGRY